MVLPLHDHFEFAMSEPEVRRPVIVHVPHAGTLIPDNLRHRFVLSDAELAEEIARSTDHAVDALWQGAVERGAIMFVNRVSRLVCDVACDDRDALEPQAARSRGFLHQKTSDGRQLRRAVPPEQAWAEREGLRAFFHVPWHDMIADTADYLLGDYGFRACTIIDARSFPDAPLPCEPDPGPGERPDICLGWDEHHTPDGYKEPLVRFFESHGFSVLENRPVAGSFVPKRHLGRDRRVRSVSIAVNRRLYRDEEAGVLEPAGAERVREALMEAFVLVDALTREAVRIKARERTEEEDAGAPWTVGVFLRLPTRTEPDAGDDEVEDGADRED